MYYLSHGAVPVASNSAYLVIKLPLGSCVADVGGIHIILSTGHPASADEVARFTAWSIVCWFISHSPVVRVAVANA